MNRLIWIGLLLLPLSAWGGGILNYESLPLRVWAQIDTPGSMYVAELPIEYAKIPKSATETQAAEVNFTAVDGLNYPSIKAKFRIRFVNKQHAILSVSFLNSEGRILSKDPNQDLTIQVGARPAFKQVGISQDEISRLLKKFDLRRAMAAGFGMDLPTLEWVVSPR